MLQFSGERILGLLTLARQLPRICTCKANYQVYCGSACYGEESKTTSAMDFAEKLLINLLFSDEETLNLYVVSQ